MKIPNTESNKKPTCRWACRAVIVALIALCVISAFCLLNKKPSPANVAHKVMVEHPGYIESGPMERTLVQQWDEKTNAYEYFMDTESVFCDDSVCEVITVRVYWDRVGFYKRYELLAGMELEKAEGLPFAKEDYEKLHQILADANSPFKTVTLKDIKYHAHDQREVDAVSGATPASFAEATVEGAAWTCFTLWHWANGDVKKDIRAITSKRMGVPELRSHVRGGNHQYMMFAIEQLSARKAHDSESINAVIDGAPRFDRELVKAALAYFEQGGTDTYAVSTERLLGSISRDERPLVLEHLLQTKLKLDTKWLDLLSRQLLGAQSYQEVDLLFRLMEQRNPTSATVMVNAIELLSHKDFLIARRAYWYLSSLELKGGQKEAVDDFQKKHHDRL